MEVGSNQERRRRQQTHEQKVQVMDPAYLFVLYAQKKPKQKASHENKHRDKHEADTFKCLIKG